MNPDLTAPLDLYSTKEHKQTREQAIKAVTGGKRVKPCPAEPRFILI